jgi:outer membrane protein insertion porin family
LSHRHLLAAVALLTALLSGCARDPAVARGPLPEFAEYEGREVRRVAFEGDLQLPVDSLHRITVTRASRCNLLFLPICIPFTNIGRDRYFLDLRELARDVVRVQLYYRDHGYYGSRVFPAVDPAENERVEVRFDITPGDQVILRDLVVTGTEEIIPPAELDRLIPLEVDGPFRRVHFLSSADSIRAALLRRGHAYAEVLRNYGIDTVANVAEAQFDAIPGPLVFVDTLVFEGNERLSERTLRRQMAVREGDLLRAVELARSQRNLYALEMVNFASVELVPDTLELRPDTALATVVVRVVEAAQYAVETTAGYGTIDCVRTSAQWVNRNFLGGARRLELNGFLSKIGVGDPLAGGFEEHICRGLRGDTLSQNLNYRATANFQQPRIFGTENQLGLGLHAERLSEFEAYLRESFGGRLVVTRELNPRTLATTTVEIENGRTLAEPLVLCIGFDTCAPEDLERLQEYRWSNNISVLAVRDGTRQEGPATRGYVVRLGGDWADPVLLSDDRYLRILGEASAYRPVRPGWLLAGNLRLGRFLIGSLAGEDEYIPPERRFYAGGPNSVRGYARNALGPRAYVFTPDEDIDEATSSATGGTQMAVASVELRMPAPFAREIMRAAVFVDAGHLSAPGTGFGTRWIRATPGAGLRFTTPVGPIRLDVAYNPHAAEAGPLYRIDEARGLVLVDDLYQPPPLPAWSLRRFRVHFAVGQAF